uniref:Uncharacterized protein n=1 Tax=Anguilla anguilla TaxID=7936 RepID=A0A0E9SMY8_ANGAN
MKFNKYMEWTRKPQREFWVLDLVFF